MRISIVLLLVILLLVTGCSSANKALQESCQDFIEALNKKLKLTPTPSPSPSNKTADKNEPDIYTRGVLNLIGLSSLIPGSTPVPTLTDFGNAGGIPDVNPNRGYAPIDRENELKTQGDSSGLNAAVLLNQIAELINDAYTSVFNPPPPSDKNYQSPSPFPMQPKPKGTTTT